MAAPMQHFRRFLSTNFTSVFCRIQENRGSSYSLQFCKRNQQLRYSHEGGNVYEFICVFLAFIFYHHVVPAEFVRHVTFISWVSISHTHTRTHPPPTHTNKIKMEIVRNILSKVAKNVSLQHKNFVKIFQVTLYYTGTTIM